MGVESTPKSVKTVGEASTQVVVLAFDLGKAEIKELPKALQTVLNGDDVKLGIQQAMNEFYLARLAEGKPAGTDLGSKDAIELFQAVLGQTRGDISDGVLKQVKSTPQFKKLEGALKDFEAALKNSPLGVFVDKNKGIIYVTGIALVVGGAAALFVTKTKSKVSDLAVGQLKRKQVPIFKAGNFALKGGLLAFQPERRQIGMGFTGTEKLGSVEVSLTVGVVASPVGVQQLNGAVVVKTGGNSLSFTAMETLPQKKTDLHVALSWDDLLLKPKVGIAVITEQGKPASMSLDASLKPKEGWEVGVKGSKDGRNYTGLMTLSIDL